MAALPPYDPRAVANLLLDIANTFGRSISNLALQKLLYFAHGHFLIATGKPLVTGAFEAWNNGPVHPAVYHAFKHAGREPIRDRAVARDIMTGAVRPLDPPQSGEVIDQLRKIVISYAHLSPGLLVAISHAPKGPWATVRRRAVEGTTLGARIPDSLTAELFRYQKIEVGVGVRDDALSDDAPLVSTQRAGLMS